MQKTQKTQRISFQNLQGAKTNVSSQFGIDISAGVSSAQWESACRSFQKRHVFAHRMGVVDQAYLDATGDTAAPLGRKMPLAADEVAELLEVLRDLGRHLEPAFGALPS